MRRKVLFLLIASFILIANACSNKEKNRYMKLAEYDDGGPYAAFIDMRTDEIVFVDLSSQKIEKRVKINNQ